VCYNNQSIQVLAGTPPDQLICWERSHINTQLQQSSAGSLHTDNSKHTHTTLCVCRRLHQSKACALLERTLQNMPRDTFTQLTQWVRPL
jgi:hypothetical protein